MLSSVWEKNEKKQGWGKRWASRFLKKLKKCGICSFGILEIGQTHCQNIAIYLRKTVGKTIFENFENGFREVILGQIRFGGIEKKQNLNKIPCKSKLKTKNLGFTR